MNKMKTNHLERSLRSKSIKALRIISLLSLTLVGKLLYAQNYTITTTGGALVVTDVSGNGETLTFSENGSNFQIQNSVTSRTYSINGGATTAFSTAPAFALAGLTGITINAQGGNDNITFSTFTTSLPNLTVNGGLGDDAVNFNGNITFNPNANLNLDLQNDDPNPGTDAVNFNSNANLLFSGLGGATIKVSKNINFANPSALKTSDGNITIEANQQSVSSNGSFRGIWLSTAVIQSTGSGLISLKGRAGNAGNNSAGILLSNSSILGGSSKVELNGIGASAPVSFSFFNPGITISGASFITTLGGDIVLIGKGGDGNASDNLGINLSGSGEIKSGGSGKVEISGTGGDNIGGYNSGIEISSGYKITSSGGDVKVIAQGGGTGAASHNSGLIMGSALITAGGSGKLEVFGTGGATSGGVNRGILLTDSNAKICSSSGTMTITGTGGGIGASTDNKGILLEGGSIIAKSPSISAVTAINGANTNY